VHVHACGFWWWMRPAVLAAVSVRMWVAVHSVAAACTELAFALLISFLVVLGKEASLLARQRVGTTGVLCVRPLQLSRVLGWVP
jgi:hypothetical protein